MPSFLDRLPQNVRQQVRHSEASSGNDFPEGGADADVAPTVSAGGKTQWSTSSRAATQWTSWGTAWQGGSADWTDGWEEGQAWEEGEDGSWEAEDYDYDAEGAWEGVATGYQAGNSWQSAGAHYAMQVKADPWNQVLSEFWSNKAAGDRFFQRDNKEAAMSCYERGWVAVRDHIEDLLSAAQTEACAAVDTMLKNLVSCFLKGVPGDTRPKLDKALACCDDALRLDPTCQWALQQKGETLVSLGRQKEADVVFANAARQAKRPQQQNWQGHLGRGPAVPRAQSLQAAQPAQSKPVSPNTVLQEVLQLKEKGAEFFKSGNLHDAAFVYSQAISLLKQHEKHWKGQAKKGEKAEQLKVAAAAIYTNMALCYLQGNEDPSQTLDFCNEALAIEPNNVKARFRKGKALTCLGKYVEAEAVFGEAKGLNPTDSQISQELEKVQEITRLVRVAQAHEALKEFDDAEDALTRASYLEPNNLSLYPEIDRLRDLATKQDLVDLPIEEEEPEDSSASQQHRSTKSAPPAKLDEKGLQDLLEKVSGLRDQGALHFKDGETHLAARSYEEAMSNLRKYEHQYRRVFYESELVDKICSTAVATLTNLALCYLQGRLPDIEPDPSKALHCCREALDIDSKNVKAMFRKGKALGALGKWAEAEAEFARAAELDPKDATIQSELRRAQEFTQESTRALRDFLFRQSWPESGAPTPMGRLGLETVMVYAHDLANAYVEHGLSGYTMQLLMLIKEEVENQFGKGSGKGLARVVPFVQRMTRGEFYHVDESSKRERTVTSYMTGLTPEEPWHNAEDYPWCKKLDADAAKLFLEELREQEARCLEQGLPFWEEADDAVGLCAGQVVNLVRQGMWMAGEDKFQKTRGMLSTLKELRPYEIMFVRSPAGATGQLHNHDSNCVLALHLCLSQQQHNGHTLRVGGSTREWRVGEFMLFDHTFKHLAGNLSSLDRVTLVCRFYHPAISEVERYALLFLATLVDAVRQVPLFHVATQDAHS